jgi:hypothetical protein
MDSEEHRGSDGADPELALPWLPSANGNSPDHSELHSCGGVDEDHHAIHPQAVIGH